MFKRKKKNPIISLLLGGVIGSAAALVMAPTSGKKTRNSIGSGVNKILYKANDQKNSLIRNAQKISSDILDKSAEIYKKNMTAGKRSIKTTDGINKTTNGIKPLKKRTREELYKIAKKKNIEGRSSMSKDELLKALNKLSS
jgi:gas vesicle protein